MKTKKSEWFAYLLECRGGSLYIGITTNISRRVNKHSRKKGSVYARRLLITNL
ncbi:MAG: GIY-YIG nuclease family protein [Candidatus Omnitrophica bacterium]|nr:GIY-YIG nuclease family protein [Candidatus Omnitrophota bacterium]